MNPKSYFDLKRRLLFFHTHCQNISSPFNPIERPPLTETAWMPIQGLLVGFVSTDGMFGGYQSLENPTSNRCRVRCWKLGRRIFTNKAANLTIGWIGETFVGRFHPSASLQQLSWEGAHGGVLPMRASSNNGSFSTRCNTLVETTRGGLSCWIKFYFYEVSWMQGSFFFQCRTA
jgi:hypothetical protein